MHRSGTSCLTGIMQNFGVELGDVFTESTYNKRGNRENGRIMYLNESLLVLNGGAWNKPVGVTNWTPEQEVERDSIIKELRERTSGHWGFKDPRTLFTLPFWQETIGTPQFIGTFRHPHRVALSLHSRDNMPFEQGWELWHAYNTSLLELAHRHQFALADFDQDPGDYLDDTVHKLIAMGLDPALARQGSEFFDSSLRNQANSSVDDIQLPEHIAGLYQQLRDYNRDYQPSN